MRSAFCRGVPSVSTIEQEQECLSSYSDTIVKLVRQSQIAQSVIYGSDTVVRDRSLFIGGGGGWVILGGNLKFWPLKKGASWSNC